MLLNKYRQSKRQAARPPKPASRGLVIPLGVFPPTFSPPHSGIPGTGQALRTKTMDKCGNFNLVKVIRELGLATVFYVLVLIGLAVQTAIIEF